MPVEAMQMGPFILSAGLFTCGEVDKALDALDFLPAEGGIRKLALALPALLPLPREYDVLAAPGLVRAWLERNSSQLRWDDADEKYELIRGR